MSLSRSGVDFDLRNTSRQYDWANGLVVASGASSAASAALQNREYELVASVDAYVTVGADPTAAADTAGNIFLAAGRPFRFQAVAGDKVAAIQDSTAGVVSILPVK